MSKTYNRKQHGIKLMAATTLALSGLAAVALPAASLFASAPVVQANTGTNVTSKVTATATINNGATAATGAVNTSAQISNTITGAVKAGDYVDYYFQNVPASMLQGDKVLDANGVQIGTLSVTSITSAFDKQIDAPLAERQALAPRGTNAFVRVTFTAGAENRATIKYNFLVRETQPLTIVARDVQMQQAIYLGNAQGTKIGSSSLTITASEKINIGAPEFNIIADRDIEYDGKTFTPKNLPFNFGSSNELPVGAGARITLTLDANSSIAFNPAGIQSYIGRELPLQPTRTYLDGVTTNANGVLVYPDMGGKTLKLVSMTANTIVLETTSRMDVDRSYTLVLPQGGWTLKDTSSKNVDMAHLKYKNVTYTSSLRTATGNVRDLYNNQTNNSLNIYQVAAGAAVATNRATVRMEYRVKPKAGEQLSQMAIVQGAKFIAENQPVGNNYDGNAQVQKTDVVWNSGRKFRALQEFVGGSLTGKVPAQTLTITQLFEEVLGSVVVESVVDGTREVLEPASPVVTNVNLATTYTAAPKSTITKNGKQYRLKTRGANYTGKVVEGTTKVTHTYELVPEPVKTGSVIVKSITDDGTIILKGPDPVVTNEPVGNVYNAPEPEAVLSHNGKDYRLKTKAANASGRVTEQTIEVIHIYEEVPAAKGNVSHISVSDTGVELVALAPVVSDVLIGSSYSIDQPATVLRGPDGKTYKYVSSDAPLTGQVDAPSKTITHTYTEIKGSVAVEIRDDQGNVLVPKNVVFKDLPVGDKYSTATPEPIIRHGGKTYKLVSSTPNGEGEVIDGEILVVHTYAEVKGSVTVTSVTDTGDVLEPKATVIDGKPVGDAYTTDAPKGTITKGGKTYKFVSSTPNTKGALIDGTIDVVHTYKEIEGRLPETSAAIGLTGLFGTVLLGSLGVAALKGRKKDEI